MIYNKLSKEEKSVIEEKGTERPFSGEYDKNFKRGMYLCRKCDSPLYRSEDKFDSGCGWPSFDDEIEGAILKSTDKDGVRTEITCANCGAHLGHVFFGEFLTHKSTRHCVNSISMRFVPEDFQENESHEVVLGGGCFWCLDAAFRKTNGIIEVSSGYAGGSTENPTYEEVCSGATGHAEVIRLVYDPHKISFNDIFELFFKLHDPTTLNRQGNDIGEQYRSIILYKTWKQKMEIDDFIEGLSAKNIFSASVVTEIRPLIKFHKAEAYHQNYFGKNPHQTYCRLVIFPKLQKLKI